LAAQTDAVLAANREDVAAGESRLSGAVLDRLRLDDARLAGICKQLQTLADLPAVSPVISREEREGRVIEARRIPVGVIGANYEARANVTVDVASQLIKSRNGGVLRTGAAALRTAQTMVDLAIGPALEAVAVPAAAISIVQRAEHEAAQALVALPRLIPLVILRGSGELTARLAQRAAAHGVRTLAHAEGGGVMFVDRSADIDLAMMLVERGLDRLGVCNRLNLLLIDRGLWDALAPEVVRRLERCGIRSSLPPHEHALGYEWAGDAQRAASVTLAPVPGALAAAELANSETSGLAATVVAEDGDAAAEFIEAYRGTGVFWNETTRLLDGFALFRSPETGISTDHVPGPRGPVTYQDLHLRQIVVRPADRS
jgi:glutamate-5-semialdehyde dehydrogenase